MVVKIAVIGAGIIGLSTAVNVQLQIPGSKVKVIAERFGAETTSYGSGGIICPSTSSHQKEDYTNLRKWFLESVDYYRKLATGPEAGKCGACLSNGYIIKRTEFSDPLLEECVLGFRKLKDTELKELNVSREIKHCYQATTVILDQRKFLQWLLDRFIRNGGEAESKKVTRLDEFVGEYDVVLNCTGFGSRELVDDQGVYPVRGQVVKVKAPWVKNWFANSDESMESTYVIPGENLVTIVGTRQVNNDSLVPDPKDTEDILQRCQKRVPQITAAEIDHVWVGLRPGREKIRLEAEEMKFENGIVKVVHNYGHNANGVALAWGTSIQAAQLAKDALSSHTAKL